MHDRRKASVDRWRFCASGWISRGRLGGDSVGVITPRGKVLHFFRSDRMSSTATTTFPTEADPANAGRGTDRLVLVAIGLTLILLAFRLVMIGQFDLLHDEVYYWLWSDELAGSYFDHPPTVALFTWLGTAIFGDTEFGVRVVGAVSVTIDAVLVYGIAKTLTDSRRIAAWAMMLSNVTTLAAMSVSIVPDQPMVMFWLISFYAMARVAKGGAPQWWLLLGLAGGLAAASKFTALIMAVAVPIWILAVPQMRRWLLTPWPYASLVMALLAFSPVLIWNSQHDWVSFVHQLERLRFDSVRFDSFLQYLTLWPAMVTPPILILAGAGLAVLLKRGWRQDPARALLVITPIPMSLYFAYHSFQEWIGPHWFSTLVWIAAIYAAIGVDYIAAGRFWQWLLGFSRRIAVPVGLGVMAVFYFALVETILPLSRATDLTARFRGWEAYVTDQERLREMVGADYILGPDYYSLAYVRFYLDDPPPAYQIGEFDRWSHFDGLGTADPVLATATAIYVGKWSIEYETAFIERYFNRIERIGDIVRPLRPGMIIEDPVWLVSDPTPEAMLLFGPPVADD